jgi:DNA-binding protein Fis
MHISINTKESKFDRDFNDLREQIRTKTIFNKSGYAGELGIYIFQYEPQDELLIRAETKKILEEFSSEHDGVNICELDLYGLALEILEDKNLLQTVLNYESQQNPKDFTQSLKGPLKLANFITKIESKLSEEINLIFITGIGKIYPYLRAHTLIEKLPEITDNHPVMIFYPGQFNGTELKLLNIPEENENNYRAIPFN